MKAARRAADGEMTALAHQVHKHKTTKGRPASMADVFAKPVADPWGNAYVLDAKGDGLAVRSFGPDGQKGTADDLVRPVVAP